MSIFHRDAGPTAAELIPTRLGGQRGSVTVTSERAMSHSAVWACRRLRADLISTSPVDCFRDVQGRAFEVPTPPVLVSPGGDRVGINEWMYSSQADLDSFGNTFGLITARDGNGLPARIDLQPAETVTVRVKGGELFKYRIGRVEYDPSEVWHEKQFTSSGSHIGMSPLAHAAYTIGQYLSAQEFALDWFRGGGKPGARLWNKEKMVPQTVAEEVKSRFKSNVANGDLFVHGADWDYEMIGAKASESEFLSSMKFGIGDVCRFLGVPGDMIDAESSTGIITYANVTQRNLQLLIMNLGPAITRREKALSNLLPRPRFVKLNTDAVVLRMDPTARAELGKLQIESRTRTVTEVREKDDLPPFTPEQVAEFAALFPQKPSTPTQATGVPS